MIMNLDDIAHEAPSPADYSDRVARTEKANHDRTQLIEDLLGAIVWAQTRSARHGLARGLAKTLGIDWARIDPERHGTTAGSR